MKKLISSIFLLLIATAIFTVSSPAVKASADSEKHYKSNNILWCDQDDDSDDNRNNDRKDKDDWQDWEDWWDWEDTKEKATDYLVLVGQANGTYIAYDDIAFITGGKYVMVKAKPLATALGMTYKTKSGKKGKKGLTLTLNQDSNLYIRNSKTYYFKDYNASSNQSSTHQYTAEYKQVVHQNYNAVPCATLRTLVNFQYYDTKYVSDYAKHGYCGVVVYNRYAAVNQLPAITSIANFNNYTPDNNNNNNNSGTTYIAVKPAIITDTNYADIKYVDASTTISTSNDTLSLDLTEVLTTYQTYYQPSNGIYGYGNCDTSITVKAYDKNGYYVGEIKTTGSEFILNFPSAVKLTITGTVKNLVMDFTPVKPTLITSNTKLAFNQISWVFQSDGYARAYFVLGDYMRFSTENVTSPYTMFRKYLSFTNYTNPDYANSHQRICLVTKSPSWELSSANCFVNSQKTNNAINNSLVVFTDSGNSVLATDYETKLISMISNLSKTGLNTYYPNTNWNRQLIMKLPDNTTNTAYNYIFVDSSYLNLDHFFDYYYTLHEMVHFYEASRTHYGYRFAAWTDGNATNLAKKTLDALSINHTDSTGKDYIDSIYSTDFSFLTQSDKNNFEAYYLNATGWNATVIGYHFTDFIQDIYGTDVVYKIMQKVYTANIPTNSSRTAAYDKQFIDCIKSATSQNIFQLFIDQHVVKNWD